MMTLVALIAALCLGLLACDGDETRVREELLAQLQAVPHDPKEPAPGIDPLMPDEPAPGADPPIPPIPKSPGPEGRTAVEIILKDAMSEKAVDAAFPVGGPARRKVVGPSIPTPEPDPGTDP